MLKVLDYTAGFLSNLLNLIDVIALIFKGATDTARSIPAVGTAAAVSACFGLSTVQSKAAKSLEFLRIPTAILSCNEEYSLVGKKFHKSVLDTYTQWITAFGAGGVGPQAEQIRRGSFSSPISVRENILLSTVSLCIPGIVENLNDLREVKCRYVYCLEKEVKLGLATVESCNELQGLLTCKYVTGELWEVIPFALFWDSAVEALKKALADPLALARTSFIVGCAANCVQSGQLSGFCDKVHFIIRVADTIESTVAWVRGIIQELKTGGGTGYCDLIS